MKSIKSDWHSERHLLRTELKGKVGLDDVQAWEKGLSAAMALIPDDESFHLLLDLVGFEAETLQAHQGMRLVIPELLATHGMRPAFVDLFDKGMEMSISMARGVKCVGFANVHHDTVKMARYEAEIGKRDQRFFTDVGEAEKWLECMRAES